MNQTDRLPRPEGQTWTLYNDPLGLVDPGREILMRDHVVARHSGTVEATPGHKRTPPHIEALLRQYNNEGITNWNNILTLLKNQGPSFEIKRSTLGEYLKECNLGSSRRKNMDDAEMKQRVLDELNQHQGRKRGVRKVWETLKSKGHHIKRDFVEKVTKELDPDGFSERRPKWKSLDVIERTRPTSSQTPPLAPSTSPESSRPTLGDGAYPVDISRFKTSTHSQTRSLPFVPFDPPRMDIQLEIDFISSSGPSTEGHTTDDSILVDVHNEVEQSDTEGARGDSDSDSQMGDEQKDDQDSCFGSDAEFSSNVTACKSDQTFWEAISKANRTEQRSQFQRRHLQNIIEDLPAQLHNWLSTPLQVTVSDRSTNSNFPRSAGLSLSFDPDGRPRDIHKGKYVPDYKVSEDQVTSDALFLALALQRALSRPKSSEHIVEVSHQLTEIRERLVDIGMSKECRQRISLGHLEVLKILQDTHGDQEWVLHALWQCAADCVHELDSDHQNTMHSDFYRATSLLYKAIRLCKDGEPNQKILKRSIDLFIIVFPLNPSYDCLRETTRAIVAYDQVEDAVAFNRFLDQLLVYSHLTTADPALAKLFARVSDVVFCGSGTSFDDAFVRLRIKTRSLNTFAIGILRSFRDARPSSIQPALSDSLQHHSVEEAIGIQQSIAKFGGVAAALNLVDFMVNYVRNQLSLGQWDDALMMATRFVELIRNHSGTDLDGALFACFALVAHHLECDRTPQALTVVHRLIDTAYPTSRFHHRDENALTMIMLTVSYVYRGLGDFSAALKMSCEVLAIVRAARTPTHRFNAMIYMKAFACHTHSLVDNNTYEEAASLLQEATLTLESLQTYSNPPSTERDWKVQWLGSFGVVHVHLNEAGAPSYVDNLIPKPAAFYLVGRRRLPCWLAIPSQSFIDAPDSRGWLLLIQTVMRCINSPAHALPSAKASMGWLSEYYDTGMEPHVYVEASVVGHKYLLLCILNQRAEGKKVLDECVTLYHSVLSSESDCHLARLPLLVFLDILLVLSRGLPSLNIAIASLQIWKKSVYNGNTTFFKEFVLFLQHLPTYIHTDI